MASTYTAFDSTKPAGTQTGTQFATSANANDVALWYSVIHGGLPSWVYAPVIGTGTAEEPQYFVWTNGAQRVRSTNTWSSGKLTQQVIEVSQDSGTTPNATGTWAAVATKVYTYDASGNITATTGAGGWMDWLVYLLAKVKTLLTNFNAHTAATGTAVHGLGTMATQTATAVNINGGTIDATVIGSTTQAIGTFKQAREVFVNATFGATTTLDWSQGASFGFTASGTGAATLSHSNLPPANVAASIIVQIVNGGLRSWTWTNTRWASGAPPTLSASGSDFVAFWTRDGGANIFATLVGKGFA